MPHIMNVAFLYITPLIYVLYPTVISSSWFFFKHSTGLSILLSIKCTHCTRIIVLNGTYHTAAFKNLIVFCFRTFRVFSKCTRCTFLKHYRILISSIDVPDPVSRVHWLHLRWFIACLWLLNGFICKVLFMDLNHEPHCRLQSTTNALESLIH